ncbi:MAG TPA: YdeI/OmpD-associated family protein [Bryobacteraceae bacterium]|nr:YdeI/OmpD-associated family protein [Bryobacteraceae bacterium]
MQSKRSPERSFQAAIEGSEKGRVYLVLPFDPEKVWGLRTRYHVRGTINGTPVRGALEQFGKGYFLPLGPTYRRGAGLRLGDEAAVVLAPEGPQSESLAPDVAGALAAEPQAAKFFDGLATFYRKNYLRWIDATKRSPDLRAQRIAEFVELMSAGRKARPRAR